MHGCILVFAVIAALLLPDDARPASDAPVSLAADGQLTLFLAGDALITQPWSADRDPAFLKLVHEIRAADVAVVNLETLFHEYKGYAQADSGGIWMASRPEIAGELAWAGFDLFAAANNHSFDYGEIGVLENLSNAAKAGLTLAGVGRDLQAARAPAYFRHPDATVALISAAATYVPYGAASRSRPDLHGRPGLNPLETQRLVDAPEFVAYWLERAARRFVSWRRVDPDDLEANLAAVKEAAARADLVIFSIHAHSQGRWLTDLAHQMIDAGTDVFFAQGPHMILGIEIYRGKPIFYCLGDFVYQTELIERLPSEFYEQYDLGDTVTPQEAQNLRTANGSKGYPARPEVWQGVAAVLRFKSRELLEVRLVPMDLGFGKPLPVRGKPIYADPELGSRLIDQVREASDRYGTGIDYLNDENVGLVDLEQDARR
jgi:poly-gamma-glutamate capsule biosynthesis protein CapA/YwtB (metallophosphatase superfamily)